MNFKTTVLAVAALITPTFECAASVEAESLSEFSNPFFFTAYYDYIGPSKFKEHPFKKDQLHYSSGNAELNSFVYYNEDCNEGAIVGLNYTYTHLGWEDNPRFEQKNFNTAGIKLAAFSGRLCDWMFKGFVNYAIDVDHPDFNEYSLYDFGAYGNYTYCEDLNLYIGFVSQLGMKVDRVWPVFGLVWQYSDRIRIDAVFPIDLNIYYKFNECWSAGIGAEFFRTRNRTGRHETLPRAIFVYENSGLDARVNYMLNDLTYASLQVGYTFGGRLKIANEHYDDAHHFKFKGAPYASFEGGIKF